METFKHLYRTACTEIHKEPNDRVFFILDRACGDTSTSGLNFSECPLNLETCRALGLALAKDVHVTHLDFSNCLLHEDGLTELLKGLTNNKTVLSLNLMGNNIRSSGTVALGTFLHRNNHMVRLNLDWNSMGILPDKFFLFCEGLACNNTLKELDIGHNQLNHLCASALATALTKNTCLETLGVSFNSFGPVRGGCLLNALVRNQTLTGMDVEGNNMGTTIEDAIAIAIKRNTDKRLITQRHAEAARLLANRLHQIENEKSTQLKALAESLERKEEEASANHKASATSIAQLQTELAEKVAALDLLNSKCQQLQTSLCKSEGKLEELSELVRRVEMETSDLKSRHSGILSAERKERQEVETRLQEELRVCKANASKFQQQVGEFEEKSVYQENAIQKLGATITELEDHLKSGEIKFKEQMDTLKERNSQSLIHSDSLHQENVAKLNEEYSKMEHHYDERIQALKHEKIHLETELGEFKRLVAGREVEAEEQLLKQRQIKEADEERIRSEMEKKLELVSEAKQKQEKLMEEQRQVVGELQAKNTALSLRLEEQVHEVQHLQQKLDGAENELKVQVGKVKLEVKEEVERSRVFEGRNEELSAEIQHWKRQVEDAAAEHSRVLKDKNVELEAMKLEMVGLQKKMEVVVEDEAKRASQLQAAVTSYITDIQRATSKPS